MCRDRKYFMYVDECGDQNLSNFEATFPIFTLCGVIFSENQKIAIEEKVNALKQRFWGDNRRNSSFQGYTQMRESFRESLQS